MNNEINFRQIAHNVFTGQTASKSCDILSPELYLESEQQQSGLSKELFYKLLIPSLRNHGLASFVTHLRTVREGRKVTLLEVLLEFIESELRPPTQEENSNLKDASAGDMKTDMNKKVCEGVIELFYRREKPYYETGDDAEKKNFCRLNEIEFGKFNRIWSERIKRKSADSVPVPYFSLTKIDTKRVWLEYFENVLNKTQNEEGENWRALLVADYTKFKTESGL